MLLEIQQCDFSTSVQQENKLKNVTFYWKLELVSPDIIYLRQTMYGI